MNNTFDIVSESNIILDDINNFNIIVTETKADYAIVKKFNDIIQKVIEFIDNVYLKLRSELQFKQSYLTKNKNFIRVGFELLKNDENTPNVYKGLNMENFMKDLETLSVIQKQILNHINDGQDNEELVNELLELKQIENRVNDENEDHYSKDFSIKGSNVEFFVDECTKGLNDKMTNLLKAKRTYQNAKKNSSNYFYNGPENPNKAKFFVTFNRCISTGLALIKKINSIIIKEYSFHTKYANRCIAAAQKYSKENKNSDSKAVVPVNDTAIVYAESVEMLSNIKFI